MSIAVHRPAGLVAGALFWASVPFAMAQSGAGLYISVPNPITTDAVTAIKSQVNPHLDAQNARTRPSTIVFDFTPEGKAAATPEIGACRNLAQFLRDIQSTVTTVAFVHGKVSGYTVLPVLTCKELVMSREALVGEVAAAGVEPMQDPDKSAFRFYIERKDQFPLVEKMYDADVKLRKGLNKVTNVVQYVDARNANALAEVNNPQKVTGVQDGQLALYDHNTAKAVGLSKGRAENRQEVAELCSVVLSSDPLGGRQPDAYRLTLKGEVDAAMRETVGRALREIRRKGGNLLVLVIACTGNDLVAARSIADDLRAAQTAAGEDARILVVGFVPDFAAAAGTVIALGCTDIVMTRPKADAADGKEAEIGDFEGYLKSVNNRPGDVGPTLASVRDLAESQGYPGLLIEGMFRKDVEIVRATEKSNKLVSRLMTREEFEKEKENWNDDGTIKPNKQLLKLKASKAAELKLARYLVDSTDPKEVAQLYGSKDLKDLEPGWLDKFADFLCNPVVTVLLVVIGFTGLILELKAPGLTVPGIIAALCFILVFWSQASLKGWDKSHLLALLLFLFGLVLIGLEIFVLPGFGVCGICGILCMLAGLALVTLDHIPETWDDVGRLGERVSIYMFAMIGSFALAFTIGRYLPKVPYANRLILNAPVEGGHMASALPGADAAAEMLGAIGTTSTALRPAGVVRVGDKFVDVVSDGDFIAAGTRVQVIQVEGTRIVVKEV